MLRFSNSENIECITKNEYLIWRGSSFNTTFFSNMFKYTVYPCILLIKLGNFGIFWQTHRHWVQ